MAILPKIQSAKGAVGSATLGRRLTIDRFHRDLNGPFDLGWREADSIPFLQHLIGASRQAIHADVIIRGLSGWKLLGEELCDGGAVRQFDLASEYPAVIIDEQNLHESSPCFGTRDRN